MAIITIDDDTVTGGGTQPDAPTSLVTESEWDGVRLYWTNPAQRDVDYIEVWRATTNNRASATKVAEVKATGYVDHSLETGTRYYWVRARSNTGLTSDYHPLSATAGVSGLPEAVADVGSATQGQVLAYDGTQWANTTTVEVPSGKFQHKRTQTGTGGNLILELVRNRTDSTRANYVGPWLGFNYTGTDGGYGFAALQGLYNTSNNHRLRYQTFTTDYGGTTTTVFQTALDGTQFYGTGFTGSDAIANFTPTGHSLNASGSATFRVWNTTAGPTVAFQAEHKRTDLTTPADGDAVDYRLRVSGTTTGYGIGKVEATYRTSGDYELSMNIFDPGDTISMDVINMTQTETTINARATAGTGTIDPVVRFKQTAAEFQKPVAFPRLTSTEISALSPVGGWTVFNTTTNKLQCYDGSAWQDLF